MKRLLLILFVTGFFTESVQAQLSIVDESTQVIDFDSNLTGVNNGTFQGNGFNSNPTSGQLDSDAWSVIAPGVGTINFGNNNSSSSFAQGVSTGNADNINDVGILAFDVGSGNHTFGFQADNNTFAPANFILKIVNNTGGNLVSIDVSYKIYYYNDNPSSTSLNFSHSDDNSTYTNISALDFATPNADDLSPSWQMVTRNTTITFSFPLSNGSEYFLSWDTDEVGSGDEDEVAFDDITIAATNGMLEPEPSNHVTGFSTGTITGRSIQLNWVVPIVGQLPIGYLVLAKENPGGTFATVTDMVPVNDDIDFSNGNGALNVPFATFTTTFTDLNPATNYDFIIYPYTNTGFDINFKTDNAPTVSATTTNELDLLSIDFDSTVPDVSNGQFQGLGFQSMPDPGQLDSDSWAITGVSGDDLVFGGTETSDGFAQGSDNGDVSASSAEAGIYAFEINANDFAFGFKPSNSRFSPGDVTLKFSNDTGFEIRRLSIDFDFLYNNAGTSAHSFKFSHSADDITYQPISYQDQTTPAGSTGGINWINTPIHTTLFLSSPISNGSDYFIRWSMDEIIDGGDEDELAFDNIIISGFTEITGQPVPSNHVTSLSAGSIGNSSIELTWAEPNSGDLPEGYIIVARDPLRDPNPEPTPSNSNPISDDFDISDGIAYVNLPFGTTSFTFNNLLQGTQYDFKIYPFSNFGSNILYRTAPAVPSISSATTNLIIPGEGSSISSGSGIASFDADEPSEITAFSFTITNDPGGASRTDINEITITQAPGNEIPDWTQLIETAVLREVSGSINETTLNIFSDHLSNLSVPGMVGNITDFEDFEVVITLKNPLGGSLADIVDGQRLVMELLASNIVTDTQDNPMADGANVNSGSSNGEVEVTASQLSIEVQPPSTAIADVALSPQPIFLALDNNGNLDRDFNETITAVTATNGLNPVNAPTGFTNGVANFASSGFNFAGVGMGTMQVNTTSLMSAATQSVTVSSLTTVTEISDGVSASPLACSTTDHALLGFSMATNGSLVDLSNLRFSISNAAFLQNIHLYTSSDNSYATAGDNTLIANGQLFSGDIWFFIGLTENLTSSANHYFVVADVIKNVNSLTSSVQVALTAVDISKGTVNFSNIIGPSFSFSDNCAPIPLEVNASASLINEFDLTQTVSVRFDERMKTGVMNIPTITLSGTNWGAQAAGSWSTTSSINDTYTTTFTHNGTEETLTNLVATVSTPSGASDFDGNTDSGGPISSSNFLVDTQKPTVTASLSNEDVLRLDNLNQTVTLTYSEDMNTGSVPVIGFTNSSSFNSNDDGAWQADGRTWIESFTHNASNENIPAETVTINPQAEDVNSNRAVTGTISNPTFSIDLLNHAPTINGIGNLMINEDASQQTVDLTGITDGDLGLQTVTTITAVSDNTALIPHPTVNYVTDAATGSINFTPVENANSNDFGTATITITVTDNGGVINGGDNDTEISFQVTVNAVNDPPTVGGGPLSINENSLGPITGTAITASDIENDDLTFSIISGDDNDFFDIDPNNGLLSINPMEGLNHEDQEEYLLGIQVQDNGTGMLTGVAGVRVNVVDRNDPPEGIIVPLTTLVESTASPLSLGVLQIVDDDNNPMALNPAWGIGDFSIIDDASNRFFIESGELKLTGSTFAGNMFNVELRVTDGGNLSHDQSFNINVVAAGSLLPPSNVTLNSIQVEEKKPVGTMVGLLETVDPNVGDTHTYSLVEDASFPDDDFFTIDNTTDQLLTNAIFDFSVRNQYEILVKSEDQTMLSKNQSFTITVIDTPPAIAGLSPANEATDVNISDNLILTLDEAGSIGAGTITIKRSLDNSVFEAFDITSAAVSGVGGTTITINPTNDFQFNTSYFVEISNGIVRDVNNNDFVGFTGNSAWAFETVNFTPDDIFLSNNEIAQGQPVSTAIGIFTSNDQDETNAHIYTLVTGDGSNDNAFFSIDGQTLRSAVVFDVSGQSQFSIRVRTNDQRGGLFEKVFTILVTTPSDNAGPIVSRASGFPSSIESGSGSAVLTFNITDADGEVALVALKAKSSSADESGYQVIPPEIADDQYSFTIAESLFDDLGISFELTATDNSNNTTTDDGMVAVGFVAPEPIRDLPSGGTETSYRIISVPYELENNSVTAVFDELGGFDDTQWRLLQHRNDGTCCLEFTRGITSIELGQGYWFNQRSGTTVNLDERSTAQSSRDEPFTIVLSPGWNMIGDPYPYTVSWNDIVSFNGDPADLEPLRVYNGSFSNGTSLEPFKGGVVRWNGSSTLPLMIPLQGQLPGGRRLERPVTHPIDAPHWEVRLKLTGNEIHNELSAFGMHPEASAGRDRYDETTVPRFFKYLEINFDNELIESKVGKDILPTSDSHTWTFTVNSNLEEEITLSWDNTYFGENDFDIYLVDPVSDEIVDMKESNQTKFRNEEEKVFQVHYGRELALEDLLNRGSIMIGDTYPNPFQDELTIPADLPGFEESYRVGMKVLNLSGQQIIHQEFDLSPGYQELFWDGHDSQGLPVKPGIYIITLKIEGDFIHQNQTRKVIKQ